MTVLDDVDKLNEELGANRKLKAPVDIRKVGKFYEKFCCARMPEVVYISTLQPGKLLVQCQHCANSYYIDEKELREAPE